MELLQMLFVATFADGSQIKQDQSDKSALQPGKSQFTDVLTKAESSPLVSFCLMDQGTGNVWGVDLTDGHFELNGVFWFPYRADREVLSNFRVIYLRNVTETMTIGAGKDRSVGYTLGFQANDPEGRNVQHVIKMR